MHTNLWPRQAGHRAWRSGWSTSADWRYQFDRQQFDSWSRAAQPASTVLQTVKLEAASPAEAPQPGAIHIKLAHVQIRIEGSADAVLLRTVLELLRA